MASRRKPGCLSATLICVLGTVENLRKHHDRKEGHTSDGIWRTVSDSSYIVFSGLLLYEDMLYDWIVFIYIRASYDNVLVFCPIFSRPCIAFPHDN